MKKHKNTHKILALAISASVVFSGHSLLANESTVPATTATTSAATSSATSNPSATTTSSANAPVVAPTGATSDSSSSLLELSLEDALKTLETGNPTLKLSDSKILIYEKQAQQAEALRRTNTDTGEEDTRKERDLNPKLTQWTLDTAKHDRDTLFKGLKVKITNQYQSILAMQQQNENLGVQLKNMDALIDQTNLQISLGLKIPSDVYMLTAQRSMLVAKQKANQNSITLGMNTLKQDLGINLTRSLQLTSNLLPYSKFEDKDIESRIANAIEKDYDKERYQRDIELTQIKYDIEFFFDNSNAESTQISVEDKKATLQNLTVTKELALRSTYNDLKVLENKLEADKLMVEADQINIEVMQKNIEVGKSTSLEMIALQNKLLDDQYTLQQDLNNYRAAVSGLQNSLDS